MPGDLSRKKYKVWTKVVFPKMSGTPTGYDDIIFQKVPKCFSQNMAKLLIMYYTTDSDSLKLNFFQTAWLQYLA